MVNDPAMMPLAISARRSMNDAITLYTFCLVIFTAVLAIATIVLAAFTIDLAVTARRTAKRQLRAYVAARAISISGFSPEIPVVMRFSMTNHGQTPAYDVSHASAIAILPHPLPPNHPLPILTIPTPANFVLHPNASFDAATVAPNPFNAVQINMATTNPGFRIYLHGTVTYRDAFDEPRNTTFCVSVVPNQNLLALSHGPPFPPPVEIAFHAAEQHNEAT
jgi:hypothetical protein